MSEQDIPIGSEALRQQAEALKLALQWKIRKGTAPAIGEYNYLDDEAIGIILAAFERVRDQTREADAAEAFAAGFNARECESGWVFDRRHVSKPLLLQKAYRAWSAIRSRKDLP